MSCCECTISGTLCCSVSPMQSCICLNHPREYFFVLLIFQPTSQPKLVGVGMPLAVPLSCSKDFTGLSSTELYVASTHHLAMLACYVQACCFCTASCRFKANTQFDLTTWTASMLLQHGGESHTGGVCRGWYVCRLGPRPDVRGCMV